VAAAPSIVTDLLVRVTPNAKRSVCLGLMEDGVTWKIKLAAPAVEGKANEALREYLADLLGTPRSRVEFMAGEKSRQKRLRVHGLSPESVHEILRKFNVEKA
jgi:uncharacterized protein (TIGR00251 family)